MQTLRDKLQQHLPSALNRIATTVELQKPLTYTAYGAVTLGTASWVAKATAVRLVTRTTVLGVAINDYFKQPFNGMNPNAKPTTY